MNNGNNIVGEGQLGHEKGLESSIDNVSQFFAHITEKLSSLGVDGDSSEEREGTLRMHTSLPTWQVLLIIQVILFYVSSIAEARTWTDVTGRTLEAEFLDFKNGNVMIKRLSDGRIFELPFSKFSQEDQSFVRSSMEKAAEPRMQIGDAGMRFDDSKMDPNYPQMQAWKEAGATQGIPKIEDQLKNVDRVFEDGATEEEIRAYFESPEVKYKSVVVMLKNGVYDFSQESVRLYSRATLIGESRDATIINISGDSDLSLYNGENIGLRNLTVAGKWSKKSPDPDEFEEKLPGKGEHRMVNMAGSVNCYVDNVKILDSASHPIWVGGRNNTIRNLHINGAYCKGEGCQGYFFIEGEKNLITRCEVTNIRHISFQNPTCKNNVFFGNNVRQEVSFHHDDGGNNLIEGNKITVPRHLKGYNAIMGPWSSQHKIGGKNFIYNNECKEERGRKNPWSDSELYIGPQFVSVEDDRDRYKNFIPTQNPVPKGRTLYPIIIEGGIDLAQD